MDKKDVLLINIEDPIEDLGQYLIDSIPIAWRDLLLLYTQELRDAGKALTKLIEFRDHVLCPRPCDIFRALYLCPWMNTKVVIIGQDPYPHLRDGVPAATGCSFECREDASIERSLENIFMVLKKTIPDYEVPDNGDLTSWATQGVLLLNASLTTTVGTPNAHKGVWMFFTKRVLEYVSQMRKHTVYMLWGKDAEKLQPYIETRDNLILTSSHPVARGKWNTFRNCDHFNEANAYLADHGRTPIQW